MGMVTIKSLSIEADRLICSVGFKYPHITVECDAERRSQIGTLVRFLLRELKEAEKRISSTIAAAEIHRAKLHGARHGRPQSMTPERAAVATKMIKAGQTGQIVWKTLVAMQGPPMGRSAYYLWLKDHRAKRQ